MKKLRHRDFRCMPRTALLAAGMAEAGALASHATNLKLLHRGPGAGMWAALASTEVGSVPSWQLGWAGLAHPPQPEHFVGTPNHLHCVSSSPGRLALREKDETTTRSLLCAA